MSQTVPWRQGGRPNTARIQNGSIGSLSGRREEITCPGRGLRPGGGVGRHSRPSGRSRLRALAGDGSGGGCCGGARRSGSNPIEP